jgi:hypothetical protein
MRNILALLAAGLLVFVGLGWYLGWYRVQSTPTNDGHRQINIDLNTKKIATDVSKGVSNGKEAVRVFLDKDGNPIPNADKTVVAQPTGSSGNWTIGDDGSITYKGEVKVPVLPNVNWQRDPK